MRKLEFNRRQLLEAAAIATGGLMLGGILPRRARAAALDKKRRFVFAYFEGGWDILLGLDPRDPRSNNATDQKIDPNYGALGAGYQARGVQRTSNGLSFGPAVPSELLAHAPRISIVNGLAMDTASHEVGRRYFNTGRFPRGLTAVGSSTPAEIIAQVGESFPIPSLSAAVESYATDLPPFATALSVNSLADLITALTPFTQLDPAIAAAVEAYQNQGPGCVGTSLNRDGLTSNLVRNQKKAREYIAAKLDQVFNINRTDAEMERLRGLYAITNAAEPSPEVLSFVAGQALKAGVSQCVAVRMAQSLDTHTNWAQDQAPRQESGWRALAALMSDLASTPATDSPGQTLLDQTTILAYSEFGRTPLFNNLRGRDHFLGNSCLLAGAGIKGGVTYGNSASIGMMPLDVEVATGRGVEIANPDDKASGRVITLGPKHVLATVLASAGLDASYLREPALTPLLA
ncbi:MAG: DUF1501 domain-containing protein [Myxococcota bacterium]